MAFLVWIGLGFYYPPPPLPLSLRRPQSQNHFLYNQLHCQHRPTTTFTPQLPVPPLPPALALALVLAPTLPSSPQLPLPPPLPPPILCVNGNSNENVDKSSRLYEQNNRPGLLEAWLVLASVKYHGNLYVLIPLNQRLALTRLRATSLSCTEASHSA